MVDKNAIRAAFSARLHEALDDAGVRRRGRGVDVHLELKKQGVNKTTQAVSKWLNGEAMAEADAIMSLSRWLSVRREWLEYGVSPKNSYSEATPVVESRVDTHITQSETEKVPLISWRLASSWPCMYQPKDISHWLYCPIPIGKNGYALKISGDSMMNNGAGKSYPEGCIIFVDPDLNPVIGDKVIAEIYSSDTATFKILAEDAGNIFLKPINILYPIIHSDRILKIRGKVVGSFIPE